MRRSLRLGLIGAGGVLAVAVAGAVVFAATFDPDTQKGRIIDAVRRATGRELVLAGPLRLAWGWSPTLEAQDAALANRPGGSRPEMATVARARAQVALWPLLGGRVEIASVVLDRPDILLETDAQGIGNWQFARPPAPEPVEPAAPGHARAAVALRRVVVENGRVTWRDGVTGRTLAVDVSHAALTLGDGPARLVADGQSSGQALHLDATVGEASPRPVTLALDAAGAHLALDGTVALPLAAGSFHGTADAAVPDLAALGPLLQVPGLPPLHGIRVALRPDGTASLHVGASPLDALRPGMALGQLDLTVASVADMSGQVAAEGSFPDGPWRLDSRLAAAPGSLALRGVRLTTPGGDVAGDVSLRAGTVQGSLVSQRLDADWLRRQAPPPPTAPAPPKAPGPAAPDAPAPARVFSDAPLPWERLRAGGAALDVSIAALRLGGQDYRGVSGHIGLADGVLRLDPFAVQAPGPLAGALTLDAAGQAVALALHAPALALPGLDAPGLETRVEVDVALHSAGASAHALAAHLDGHAGLAMVDGAVSNAALLAALRGVLPEAVSRQLDPSGRSAVRCLALRLDAHDGQVAVSALRLDTGRLDLDGDGGIDLATEALALRLRPTVRLGGAGVLAPVRVEGTLAHPAAALDHAGVEGRAGLVIGGASAPDDCGPALALARDGHAGRLPVAQAVKPPKPADLLRSLLR